MYRSAKDFQIHNCSKILVSWAIVVVFFFYKEKEKKRKE